MSNLRQFLYEKNKSEIDQYFDDQAKFYLEKQKLERIDNFNGYFDFLNNEYPCQVFYEGLMYKSVSHAFQAARSTEQHMREKISRSDTVMEMYEIAEKIDDPPDWLKNRVKVMEILLRDKFRRNTDLREKLRATELRELINTYADQTGSNLFWGVVDNRGQNQLGRLIESVRNDVHHNLEMEKWIFMTFNVEDDKNLLPDIKVEVLKNGEKIEDQLFIGKNHITLGKIPGSDIMMTHESISRRHACIICDSKNGVSLIDLGSKQGSFVDDQKCNPNFPYKLKIDGVTSLKFGVSTRKYNVTIDYSKVGKYLAKKKQKIINDMKLLEKTEDPNQSLTELKASLGYLYHDTVFIGGLPENPSEREVETLMAQFGKIKSVRIPKDKQTGKNRPIAFVTFADENDCKKAIGSNGMTYKNKILSIRVAEKNQQDIQHDRDRGDKIDKESYKKRLQENEERINKALEKKERRKRSRSRSDSGRRKRSDRDINKDKDKSRKDKKRRSSSSRSSGSSDDSKSRSRSHKKDIKNRDRDRSKERDEKNKKDKRDVGNEKKPQKDSNSKRDNEKRSSKEERGSGEMDIEKDRKKERKPSREKDSKRSNGGKREIGSPEKSKRDEKEKSRKDKKSSKKRSASSEKEKTSRDKKKRDESSESSSSGSSSSSSRSGSDSSKSD